MYKNPYVKIEPSIKKPYTEVYLVRHCHPDYDLEKKVGSYDMPLSKIGLKQRRLLTKKLLKMSFNAIYSSGLKRAQETAEEYVKKTGMNLIVDYRLDEIDWVHWHKIKYFNMTEQTRKKNLASHRILDKQLDKMQIVARRTLADICRSHRGKKIIIFTHGNFIRALITGILNADIIGFLSLEIFQSSVSKFIVDSDGYVKISFVNDASHLPMIPLKDYFITLAD